MLKEAFISHLFYCLLDVWMALQQNLPSSEPYVIVISLDFLID